jgi:hypothetical protein
MDLYHENNHLYQPHPSEPRPAEKAFKGDSTPVVIRRDVLRTIATDVVKNLLFDCVKVMRSSHFSTSSADGLPNVGVTSLKSDESRQKILLYFKFNRVVLCLHSDYHHIQSCRFGALSSDASHGKSYGPA